MRDRVTSIISGVHEDTLYYQPVLWITGTGLASNDNSVLCEIASHLMSGECRSTRGLRRVAGMSVDSVAQHPSLSSHCRVSTVHWSQYTLPELPTPRLTQIISSLLVYLELQTLQLKVKFKISLSLIKEVILSETI